MNRRVKVFLLFPVLMCSVLILEPQAALFELLPPGTERSQAEARERANAAEVRFIEPIVTEETIPTEKGELDLRLSLEYGEEKRNLSATAPRLQLFYGVIERLSVEVNLPFEYRKNETKAYALGDISTSLKGLVLAHGERTPAVVLGIEAGFPTGNKARETGDDVFEITPFLAILKQVSVFTIQGNLGWSKEIGLHGAEASDSFVYNWAAAYPIYRKTIHVLAEINGRHPLGEDASTLAFAPGIKYNLRENQFIALAFPVGLNRETAPWRIVAQFQIGF